MAEERDDLKRRYETARQRNEFLEVEVKKMAKEIDDFSRENNSIRQGRTLLEQDKEYHGRVIRSARIFPVERKGAYSRVLGVGAVRPTSSFLGVAIQTFCSLRARGKTWKGLGFA